ncbi:MAG: hypothetical protein IGS03_16685 [Candidatus Sericytochromatia bacterium]|nr:hypothetical protein [Candidatus Sericytochromatia bacterium]
MKYESTQYLGIYRASNGAYYLRDLRTGQMLPERYLLLNEARTAQNCLESTANPDDDVLIDVQIDAMRAELDALEDALGWLGVCGQVAVS